MRAPAQPTPQGGHPTPQIDSDSHAPASPVGVEPHALDETSTGRDQHDGPLTEPSPALRTPERAASPASENPSSRRTRLRNWVQGFLSAGTAIGATLGLLSGVLTTLFLLGPNLAPSTANKVVIGTVAIEPAVTLAQYYDHPSIRDALRATQEAYPERSAALLSRNEYRLDTVGTAIHYQFETQGLHRVTLGQRWSLFDADTGRRLAESEDLDPLPLSLKSTKKDVDVGAWEIWVDTSGLQARSFFARLELVDEETGARLTFKDSDSFTR